MRWAERRSTSAPAFAAFSGDQIWPEWSTQRAVKEGYKASYILYSVASDLADCIRQVPWQLKRKTKDGADIVDNHPLIEMIRSPNDDGTWGSLLEAWDLYKSLAGNAYGRMIEVGGDLDAWNLRPDRIEIKTDSRGHISAYKYTVNGSSEYFPPEEILHFRFFDPGSDHLGLAPLQAAARMVDTSNSTIDWNKNLIGNRGRPSGMIAPKNDLEDKQYQQWHKNLRNQVQGPKNAGKIIIQPFGAEFVPFDLTPAELDYLKAFDTYEAAICKAFHVHPEAIGALGATFENKEWAIRAKWEGPVTSRLSEMRATLNHRFRKQFGTSDPKVAKPGDLFLDFDLAGTPLADYQQGKALERAQRAWACGVPWNVASSVYGTGLPPIDGGDQGYLPVNLLPIGAPVDQLRSTRSVNLETADQIRAHVARVTNKRTGWARGVAVKVGQRFAEERAAVVKAIESGVIDCDPIIDG